MSHTNIDNHGVHSVEKYALPAEFQRDYELVTQKLKDYANGTSNMSLHEMTQLPHDKIMQHLIRNQQTMGAQYNEFLNLFNAYYQKRYPKSMVSPVPTEITKKEVKVLKTQVDSTKQILDTQRDYALATLSKNNKKVEDLQKALNVVLPKDATYGTFGPITLKALVEYQKLHQKELNISDKELGFFGPKTYALLFPSVQASAPTPVITPKVITEQTPEVVKNSSSSARSASASSVASSSPSLDIRPVGALSNNSSSLSFQGHSTSLRSSSSSSSSVRSAVGASSSSPSVSHDFYVLTEQSNVDKILALYHSSQREENQTGKAPKPITVHEGQSSVDYIRIVQDDGDVYLWDKPQNNQRTVYQLDNNNRFLAKAIIKQDGTFVENNKGLKGLKYDPINNQ